MQIAIDAKILFEMQEYAAWAEEHYESEIAGWGHYNKDEGIYKLAPLTKQVVHSAEALASPDELLESDYDMSDMIVQWHSHVRMGVSPSQPDVETRNLISELSGMVISIIINLKGEHSCYVTISKVRDLEFDVPHSFKAELLPYYVNSRISKDVKKQLKLPPPPKPVKSKQAAVIAHDSSRNSRDYGYGYGAQQHGGYVRKPVKGEIKPDKNKIGYSMFDEILFDTLILKLMEEADFCTMLELKSYSDDEMTMANYYSDTAYKIIRKEKRGGLGTIYINDTISSWAELVFDLYGFALPEHMITHTENTTAWVESQRKIITEGDKKEK